MNLSNARDNFHGFYRFIRKIYPSTMLNEQNWEALIRKILGLIDWATEVRDVQIFLNNRQDVIRLK